MEKSDKGSSGQSRPVVKLPTREKLIADLAKPRGTFQRATDNGEIQRQPAPHQGPEKPEDGANTCRRHMIVLPGTGKKEFPLPTADELIAACNDYIQNVARIQQSRARARNMAQGGANTGSRGDASIKSIIRRGKPLNRQDIFQPVSNALPEGLDKLSKPQSVVPVLPAGPKTNANGSTLWAAAGGLADIMHDGKFEAHIAEVFDHHVGVLDWARRHMAPKYQPTVESLGQHFGKIQELYRETLPSVMHGLAAQYREATEEQLIEAAVSVVNQQLSQILYVLSMWTSSFAQQRDGKYRQLLDVVFTLEQCVHLFNGGDMKGHENCDPNAHLGGKNMILHQGDVFMPLFGPEGPATIPSARGPVGSHLVLVPHDEREIIALMLPIYLHEFRHDYFEGVEKLPQQSAIATIEAIDKAHAEGRFKFSSETVKIGNQEVKTIDLVKQLFVQTLPENDADIAGGANLSGPAFLYSLIATFSAFNSKGRNIFSVPRLLRASNRYAVSEQGELVFAPHMPDLARAFMVAAALELQGFPKEAEECRRLAEQAGGEPLPKVITWFNGDPKSRFKFKIQIPLSDLEQVFPVAADTLINAKLECLGGVSTGELVNWSKHRQDKVDVLTAKLMAGESDIPEGFGDVFATYVAAAAITAYWGLCKSGVRPRLAATRVEGAARKMLDNVRKVFNEPDSVDPKPIIPAGTKTN